MSKFVIQASWEDVPHLTEEDKQELKSAYMPHELEARTKGIPSLGAGAIYPIPEDDVLVDPFEIPFHWPRVYGMDVGWNRTAVIWVAIDPDTNTAYLYSEHYRGNVEPSIHADAVKARGAWIPGVVDPAANGRSQIDGSCLLEIYNELGLELAPANNAVEAGIYSVWQRLSAGKLKVFKSLTNWISEFRIYRRDDKGKVVKKNDHAMDATRYAILSGIDYAITRPAYDEDEVQAYIEVNEVTGY